MRHWVDNIGKYQLVGEIARGGMGIVYLAVARGPKGFSKLLVLKELKADLVEDPVFLEMFLEEARLAARLNHPNIVHTYDVGAEGSRHYIVMDYLEGYTLARVLRKKSDTFSLSMHLRVLCEVLSALHYAHTLADYDGTALGIVHRDATPQNVFLTFDGQVKLVDFGIAKAVDGAIETRAGILKGKPAYMAPEQIGGDVDPRVDIFAVGVMLWEAIAGRRMWEKQSDIEVLGSLLKGDVPELKEIAADAPAVLCKIVERATAKQRDGRYATAEEMRRELEAYLASIHATATSRDIGELLSTLFATERAQERATIETHLARVKEGESRSSLPSIRPLGFEGSGTPSNPQPMSTPAVSSQRELISSPSSVGKTPSGTELPSQTPVVEMDQGARRRKGILGIVAGAGAIAVVVALVSFVASRNGRGAASAPPPVAPVALVQPAAPAATAEPPREHSLVVSVVPSSAALMIDGRTLASPATRSCVHGESVLVRASKPGFATKEREVLCEGDATIELALETQAPTYIVTTAQPNYGAPGGSHRQAPVATAEPTAVPTAVTAPTSTKPASDVSPTGGTKPNRPIDTSSPYGNP